MDGCRAVAYLDLPPQFLEHALHPGLRILGLGVIDGRTLPARPWSIIYSDTL